MFFYLPTRVYTGTESVRKHAQEWTALGNKALIVTSKSSEKNGARKDVTDALKSNHTDYYIYDEIEQNPSVETIMKVRKIGLEQKADFVVGIGGGSPMDAAKAIALMMANPQKDASFLYQVIRREPSAPFEKETAGALPLVEVPTTCGTGSEATPYAILTVHEKKTKSSIAHHIFPQYALVDGTYLKSAPRSILVNTAVDAMGHFLESYINVNATDYSRMFCEYGLSIWNSCKHVLIGGEASAQDYERMMLASTLAGMAISHTGTALPHALSYYLTYEKGIPHGKAVGYFLPGYLEEAGPMEKKKLLAMAGFPDFQYFKAFMKRLTGEMEADRELLEKAIEGTLQNKAKLKNVPFLTDKEVLCRICGISR